jgi:hypothetical protein
MKPTRTTTTPRYLLDRRRFLKSLGMAVPAVALPVFRTSPAFAAAPPPRLVFLWYPNGTILDMFWPSNPGTSWTIPAGGILEPLMPFRAKLNVLFGVHADSTDAGPGSAHQKGAVAALTGGHALAGSMNGGNNSPSGFADRISVDQYIASKWSANTRLKTLDVAVKRAGMGNRHAISYLGPNQPVFPVDDPAKVFATAFGNFVAPVATPGAAPDPSIMQLLAERHSVLDYVNGDLNRLSLRLPGEERVRLQRHLDSLRDLERQIAPTVVSGKGCSPGTAPTIDPLADANYPMVTKIQMDIMFQALACDQTRLMHLMWNGETSQQTFPWLGINNPHHSMSHAGDGDKGTKDNLVKVDRWYAEQVAYFLGKLDAVVEGNGKTMLDNSVVVWTNGLGKGNSHTRKNIPYVMAGSAGGYFATGRYLQLNNRHNDLMVSLINAMGLPDEKTFGDPAFCKGPLPGLTA